MKNHKEILYAKTWNNEACVCQTHIVARNTILGWYRSNNYSLDFILESSFLGYILILDEF